MIMYVGMYACTNIHTYSIQHVCHYKYIYTCMDMYRHACIYTNIRDHRWERMNVADKSKIFKNFSKNFKGIFQKNEEKQKLLPNKD